MLTIIGYALSVLIGFSLGLVGGGGSILVIPVLVFLFKIDPAIATTYSLFIVGLSALFGSFNQIQNRNIEYRTVIQFGIPSVLVLFVIRKWLLVRIPQVIFQSGTILISKPIFIMVAFSSLMLAVGYTMIRQRKYEPVDVNPSKARLVIQGALTGAVTGFIGIGGGFIIVPSLVLFAGLPMRKAIATSLMIITVNCFVGIIGSWNSLNALNYPFLIRFSTLAILGILLGGQAIRYIPDTKLKPIFGWIILVMSILVFMRIFLHF